MNPKPRLWWLCGSRITSTCAFAFAFVSSVSSIDRVPSPPTGRDWPKIHTRLENPTPPARSIRHRVVARASSRSRRARRGRAPRPPVQIARKNFERHLRRARASSSRSSSVSSSARSRGRSRGADTAVVASHRARSPRPRTLVHGAVESTDEYFRPRRGVTRAHGVAHGRRLDDGRDARCAGDRAPIAGDGGAVGEGLEEGS